MADFIFNVAKGRLVEFANRVEQNDPTNAAFVLVVIDAAGDTDATMKDRDTLAALTGGTANEVTNSGYSRKTLANGSLTLTLDDTGDTYSVDIADQTWSAISAGDAWTDLLVCYDSDTTTGDDTNIVPISCHDFAVTPNGGDIIAQINASGLFTAS